MMIRINLQTILFMVRFRSWATVFTPVWTLDFVLLTWGVMGLSMFCARANRTEVVFALLFCDSEHFDYEIILGVA